MKSRLARNGIDPGAATPSPAAASRGLTLVEVVVAAAILAIAAMGLAGALVTSLRAGSVARERTVAIGAAEARLAADVAAASSTGAPVLLNQPQPFAVEGLTPVSPGVAAGSTIVSPWVDDIVRVDVTVRWSGSLGPDAVTLTTLVRTGATGRGGAP